jgi:hypothetical protein
MEGLGKFKKSNDLFGNRNRDLPACGIVPQPTKLPRAPNRPYALEMLKEAICTKSVSTSECERYFSAINNIKE